MGSESLILKIIIPFFSAFFGFMFASYLKYQETLRQKKHDVESLKAAFFGEISAIIDIIDAIDMPGEVEKFIEKFRRGESVVPIDLSVKQKYFNV